MQGLMYASAIAFDASTNFVYVADLNFGKVYIVVGQNNGTGVDDNGTPQAITTDGTFVYFADISGVGRANKTTGASGSRVWSGANTFATGVAIDPATGRVWAAVKGTATGQVASCDPAGSGCTTWSVPNMEKVHIVNGVPYLVTTDGIYACASTADCSHPTSIYAVSATNEIVWDSKYIYFSNSSAGIYKCTIGGCNQNPTYVSAGGAFAADLAIDSLNVYWLTGAGVVQGVAK
jgi:DNA-binding beta-propeller fold protein YncE